MLILFIPALVGVILLLLRQYDARNRKSLAASAAANAELAASRDGLEQQVAARTAELRGALAEVEQRATEQARLAQELAAQREAIRELSVPVLPVSKTTLVMPLIGALDSQRLNQVQEQALRSLEQSQARRLVLDITGVPIVDTQVAQGLLRVVDAARLLGASVTLVGIRPEVAQTVVGLGVDLHRISTNTDLQSALR